MGNNNDKRMTDNTTKPTKNVAQTYQMLEASGQETKITKQIRDHQTPAEPTQKFFGRKTNK